MEPVDFVKERLDEWEQAARYAGPGQWQRDGINSVEDSDGRLVVYGDGPAPSGAQVDHMVLHDPARVLAQVAAMRAIVGLYERLDRESDRSDGLADLAARVAAAAAARDAVRHLAATWHWHDDYDPAWVVE